MAENRQSTAALPPGRVSVLTDSARVGYTPCMSQSHSITGVTTLTIAGEERTLACDMNCAAVLHEAVGERWPEWLTNRFLGITVEGGRKLEPLAPADIMLALYALLGTDRVDQPRTETVQTLTRSIGPFAYAETQVAVVRCVAAAFGLPGKFVDAVLAAVDVRPEETAPGTGVPSAPLPLDPSASLPTGSGTSRSPSGTPSSTATPRSSKRLARKKPGKSHS